MEVTIDGRKITLDGAVTVLEAARSVGVDIPTLCWHPRVSVLGACRLCMVEVEGINRLLAACTTQVSDGMVVNTDTPQLRKVRQVMLELLLCRHPLDCPTCVKGGECELQELAYRYSSPENRFPENPAPYPVRDPSPFLERDPKKCVLCRRCVRVCREVRGVTVLGAMERGYHKRVGTFFQESLDSDFQDPYNCEFCGACIDICPVGALNKKQRKFTARSWEGERSESVCPFCSFGCLLTLQVKEGELVRVLPRQGGDNEDQACFRGRFGTDYVNSPERLIAPMLRRNGELVPAGEAEAVRHLAGAIKKGGSIGAVVSASLTREEGRAVREFMQTFAPQGVVTVADTLGLEESFPYGAVAGGAWKDLDEADLVLVAGQDFTVFEPLAGVKIRLAGSRTGASLAVLDGRDSLLGNEADLWVRPAGSALPLLLAAVIRTLAASHGERLRGEPDEGLLARFAVQGPGEAEEALALPSGAVEDLARRLAESTKAVFLTHRGWYDPPGLVPLLLAELGRLLDGEKGSRLICLGRDCNSRGLSAAAGRSEAPDLLLLFGADPLGTALPASPVRAMVEGAGSLAVFDTYRTKSAAGADVIFPQPHFAEKEGTFEAAAGAIGKLHPAMDPAAGVGPLWDTLDEVALKLGQSLSFAPSLQEDDGGGEAAADRPPDPPPYAPPPPAGERVLVLRAIPIADGRVRLVEESAALFPGARLEVHPGSLEAFGLREGGRVRLLSGEASLERTVKADLKTPPGQMHLPYDPHDEDLAAFAAAAERPEGWPVDTVRLTACDDAGEEG